MGQGIVDMESVTITSFFITSFQQYKRFCCFFRPLECEDNIIYFKNQEAVKQFSITLFQGNTCKSNQLKRQENWKKELQEKEKKKI